MKEDFGSTWRPFRAAVRTGAILGPFTSATVVVAAWMDDRPLEWTEAVLGGVVMALLVPLFVLPTVLFSIRIEDGVISHRLFRRWRLSLGRVVDLTKVEVGGHVAARLYFANGSRISLLAADPREVQALCLHLVECRPDFENFVFSHRMAKIAKVVKRYRITRASLHPVLQVRSRRRLAGHALDATHGAALAPAHAAA